MNIGVAQWCFRDINLETISRASQAQCNCVHLDSDLHSGKLRLDNQKVREQYLLDSQKYRIQLLAIGVNSLCDYGMKNSLSTEVGQVALNETLLAIEAAAAMKIPLVTLPSFFQGQIHTSEDFDNTVKFLKMVVQIAKDCRVELALENSLSPNEQLLLCQKINSPNIKILFDTYNPLVFGHDPLETWHLLREYICPVIHIKDGRNSIMGNTLIGDGDAPIQQLLPIMLSTYPETSFIIETEYLSMQEDETELLNRDMETLKKFLS